MWRRIISSRWSSGSRSNKSSGIRSRCSVASTTSFGIPSVRRVPTLRFLCLQRLVWLSLEEFGSSMLEGKAERYSASPAELGRQAVRYYLSDRDTGRTALRVPRLSRSPARHPVLELRIDLDPDSWRELDEEAHRQEVSVERLIEHAIMYFLADLDAGLVEQRMLDDRS
jgi:hypothetical protein